ncbi:hypothetical protein IT084_06415 [Desulfallas sp. Bu1-1]|uniref:NfeD family protein n=1 Tax=Desulfallas sp. Bu1-1 TaxID=2787620 RepID=UPI00189CA1ED|nr:NfeD family protein [Desulfallas sp. Bu1-1]MBF7082612.1 hypothetical protein [Desulfallas sp. Bu1-1]
MPPELVPWLAVLAFLLGILALALELFIYGFGIAGVTGIILIGWGILLLSVDVFHAFKALVIALVLSVVLFVAGVKLVKKANIWGRVTLVARQKNEAGYTTSREELGRYIGMEGVAITPLRPAGAAEINGERLDVVSEGGFIHARAKIRVVKVEGGRIVVRAVTKPG